MKKFMAKSTNRKISTLIKIKIIVIYSTSIYKKANVLLVSINCDLIRVKGKLRVDLFNFKKTIIEFDEKIREKYKHIFQISHPLDTKIVKLLLIL